MKFLNFQATIQKSFCKQGFNLAPDDKDCGIFYKCKNVRILINCPGTLAFNVLTQNCDYPWNVKGCEGYTAKPLVSSKDTII